MLKTSFVQRQPFELPVLINYRSHLLWIEGKALCSLLRWDRPSSIWMIVITNRANPIGDLLTNLPRSLLVSCGLATLKRFSFSFSSTCIPFFGPVWSQRCRQSCVWTRSVLGRWSGGTPAAGRQPSFIDSDVNIVSYALNLKSISMCCTIVHPRLSRDFLRPSRDARRDILTKVEGNFEVLRRECTFG